MQHSPAQLSSGQMWWWHQVVSSCWNAVSLTPLMRGVTGRTAGRGAVAAGLRGCHQQQARSRRMFFYAIMVAGFAAAPCVAM